MVAFATISVILGAILGFFLPGYLISVLLRSRAVLVSSFLISAVVLFNAVFWLGVCGVPVRLASVGLVLLAVVAGAGLLMRARGEVRPAPRPVAAAPWTPGERLLLYAVAGVAVVFALRAVLQALSGWDTPWRWSHLAVRLQELGAFGFYPPVRPDDYRLYAYPDGIPPLVSFAYWWLYALLGRPAPPVTALFVIPQGLLTGLVALRLGETLAGRRAGVLSLAVLASSPLFFWAVVMGQETGLTALSLSASLYFIVTAADGRDWRAIVCAGTAAAVGALSREYGIALVAFGALVCLWRTRSLRLTALFTGLAVVLAGPWYLRNWVLTGNPVFDNPVGSLFPVHPVHLGTMVANAADLGWGAQAAARLGPTLTELGRNAPLQLGLGIAAVLLLLRRCGWLALGTLVVVLLWAYSVALTAGGVSYSMRMLSPALVLLSVAVGVAMVRLGARGLAARIVIGGLVAACLRAIAYDLVVPANPMQMPPRAWAVTAFMPAIPWEYVQHLKGWPLPPAGRILVDDCYLHTAFSANGPRAVPIYSPEVAFLFDPHTDLTAALRGLRERDIRFAAISTQALGNSYLKQFPFFAQYPGKARVVSRRLGVALNELPEP